MTPQHLFLSVLVMAPIVYWSPALASEASHEGIGLYTAVSGHVVVTHRSEGRVVPVKLHDQVWFKDVIETKGDSRTKAFFDDDSMLTVGTNSRVEIDEYVYQPDKNVRRAIVKLMQGQVRALVSKVFKANGSKFEVHTPSAVAAARGTYFTVWIETGQSGIINIGETGRVDFTSGGVTVAVDPGYFSVAREGQAPSTPMEHHLGRARSETETSNAVAAPDRALDTVSSQASAELTEATPSAGLAKALVAVERTLLREELLLASPIEALTDMDVDARIMASITRLSGGLLEGSSGESVSVTTDTFTNGSLLNGSISIGTSTTSLTGSVFGSVSGGSTAVAPITSTVSTIVAPLAPVISTVTAPLAPVISTVVAPATPVVNTILTTPPAVINGAVGILK
jgi:hypothetical protein